MRILHVIDSMRRGGAERMLVDIANNSLAAGHEIRVCVTRGEVEMAKDLRPGIPLDLLGRRGRYDPIAPLSFARYLRQHRPDVVHLHARASLPFVSAGKLLALLRVPILMHDHFGGIENDRSIPNYFRYSKRAITHYVGVADQLGDWARAAGVPANRVSVIENAIDLSRFACEPAPGLREQFAIGDRLLGVMVANQHKNKGIEVMIDALGAAKHRDRISIIVAGEAPDEAYSRSLRERRDRLGLEKAITFLGARGDVPAVLRAGDFALHSSHTESGPLVLVEYIACGLPFASTCTGSIGRKLRSLGIPGFVDSGDSVGLAAEIDRIAELSSSARVARASAARPHLETWDLHAVMNRWFELYTRLVTG